MRQLTESEREVMNEIYGSEGQAWVLRDFEIGFIAGLDYQRLAIPEGDAAAELAALTAERDALREAVKNMLHIFDRGLAEGTMGRIVCERARQALEVTK